MKGYLVLSLLALAFVTSEELDFLSDDIDFTDGLESNSWDSFINGTNAILDIAQKAINIFKSSNSKVIKERIQGKGFDFFKGGCSIKKLNGLFPSRYEMFTSNLLSTINLPLHRMKEVKDVLAEALWVDQDTLFKNYELAFNPHAITNDEVHSLTLMIGNNNRGTLDVFYSFMHANFKLAPDITIMTVSKSKMGGLTSSVEDKIIKSPRSITPDEVRVLITFMEYIGLQQFADILGIRLPPIM